MVLLNKWDMAEVFEFDLDFFTRGVRMVNPHAPILPISARTGEGVEAWMEWLVDRVRASAGAASGTDSGWRG